MADGGTITRGGEGTDILVCVHKADATFYYDEEVQTLFAYVDYPVSHEAFAQQDSVNNGTRPAT